MADFFASLPVRRTERAEALDVGKRAAKLHHPTIANVAHAQHFLLSENGPEATFSPG
jgi:hypothetical protein